MKLILDFESRSRVDLKKQGTYVYAESPTTEVLCVAVSVDGADPVIMEPFKLAGLVMKADELHAHNAQFERLILKHVVGIDTPISKWRCTAAKAAYSNLPRDLDGACRALGLAVQKDKEGSDLMKRLCKPDKKTDEFIEATPEQFARLCEYCKQDVRAELALDKALPEWPADEIAVWHADQAINDRGIYVDDDLLGSMARVITSEFRKLEQELQSLTEGEVNTGKQTAAMLAWLKGRGLELENLQAATVEEALALPELSPIIRRILTLRSILATSAVAKVPTMRRARCKDGRIRGTILYYGASQTGRFSGKLVQVQNFPRPSAWVDRKTDAGHDQQDQAIDMMKRGEEDVFPLLWCEPLEVVSSCLRGALCAAPGSRLVVADYAAIEARVAAWLAGDDYTCEAFRNGAEIYKITAASIYGIPEDQITKDQRNVGKVACIAEGEQVITDCGIFPIEKVEKHHKVWDGTCFVAHQGIVYKGIKEVTHYDGLWATEDHIVFTEDGQMSFGAARAKHARLLSTGPSREGLRVGGDTVPGAEVQREVVVLLRPGSVPELRGSEVDMPVLHDAGKEQGVPKVLGSEKGSRLAVQTGDGNAPTLYEPEGQRMEELRRSGDQVYVPIGLGRGGMGDEESRAGAIERVGSNEQRRELRAGESEVRNKEREHDELPKDKKEPEVRRMGASISVGGAHDSEIFETREHPGTDCGAREESSEREAQELEGDRIPTRISRVYDIVNAGPRNRFTVSGKLVHNCLALGFQGWVGAFQRMASVYNVQISDEEAANICGAWREAHEEIRDMWHAMLGSAIQTVQTGAEMRVRGIRFVMEKGWLRMGLPSGRSLAYYQPQVVEIEKHGKTRKVVQFWGVDSKTHKWSKILTYGGKLFENAVQATARDLLASVQTRLVQAGAPVIFSVHDELVLELGNDRPGTHDILCKAMCKLPAWADGLPIAAAGWTGQRYRK